MKPFRNALLIVTLALMAGCAETVQEAPVANFPYVRMAPMAPPAPVEEAKYYPNEPTLQLWRPGYWNYNGRGFDWVSGEFIERPSPAAAWSPDRWEQRTYGWVFISGYWQ